MKKNHIASNIKLIRLYSGLSQNDFAKLFDVSRDNVASYERGSEPKVSFLTDLVNYFHITFEDLINNELNPTFFETKCAQNATLANGGENGGKEGDKRNVCKTPPFASSEIAPTIIDERDPRDAEIIELQKKHIALLEQQVVSMAEQIDDLKKELEELSGFVAMGAVRPAASVATARTDNPKGGDSARLNRP